MIRLLKTMTLVALSAVSLTASAQDLLANRAPSDRKLTDLKTIKINNTSAIAMADLHNPAGDIYSTWDHTSALIAPGALPPNFKVDLRGFAMPTPSRKITSKFGPRWGRQHKGLDIKVYIGDTIYAAFDGKVRIVKYNAGGWGYYVVLRHPNGLETLYGHLSKQLVKEDQIVRAGEPIGLGGNSGSSTGSHLHFETRLLGTAINPALMFDFEAQDVTGDYYVYHKNSYGSESAEATRLRGVQGSGSYNPADVNSTAVAQNRQVASTQKSSTAKSGTRKVHKVKNGETLYRIATKYGVSVDRLRQLNGLKKNANIRPGQLIRYS